jgi:hypothetical protein
MNNPAGDDVNNCTIISLSLAACIPYKEADEIGMKAGRERNEAFYLEPLYKEARKKGIRIEKVSILNKTNLKQFILDYPIGRFVVSKSDHAFCVINGIVHDVVKNGNNSIVESAYYFNVESANKIRDYFKDNYFN